MSIRLKQFTKYPNAGDVASRYVVSKLLRRDVELVGEEPVRTANLIAIGSILHWAGAASIVWGTGLLSESMMPRVGPGQITAVRGRLTQKLLVEAGFDVPKVFGDPGMLISDFFCVAPAGKRCIGVVPHYVDLKHPFVTAAQEDGAVVINPLSPLDVYLTALANSSVVVSSSLHGIVFAHAFGVPAVWVQLSENVLGSGFKFRDYYSSIGFDASEVPDLTGASSLQSVVDHATLPREEIDRPALREALLAVAARLDVS